jgi:8-oxo-dGTP pyrophosphatase MutT (NUDIX family)
VIQRQPIRQPSSGQVDPGWLAALLARAQQPARSPRVPLYIGGHAVGSVERSIDFGVLTNTGAHEQLLKREQFSPDSVPAWSLHEGDLGLAEALRRLAQCLHDANLGHVRRYWRNELLAVRNEAGEVMAGIERGVVRPLGLATRAVHLVGWTADGGIWVQQRAFSKANDPGQWDTLMGGMVSAQDDVQTALSRETWEEAGLHLHQLQALAAGGTVRLSRPSEDLLHDPQGIAYTVEDIDWYQAVLPKGLKPSNQDGEVEQFEWLTREDLIARLHANLFTDEAALILVAALNTGFPQ